MIYLVTHYNNRDILQRFFCNKLTRMNFNYIFYTRDNFTKRIGISTKISSFIYIYRTFNNNYHIGVGQIFRSGPGGTITASTTATYTVGVTSNVSASITTGQIVKASISAGFSNSTSSSRSTSYKYSRSISPGRYGNMQYGNYGAQVNVKKPPLSLHAMSKCSLLEAQSCPVRTYGVTDIGKARPL